jgi:copper chaperone CopZ
MDQPRRFRLEGMHCGSCVARITDAVQNHHGVQTVRVDLAANRMDVWAPYSVSDAEITAAVAKAGDYQAVAAEEPSVPKPPGAATDDTRGFWETYRPLFTLALLLAVVPTLALGKELTLHSWMRWFMAGFFLSFSYFKLLDVRAFAATYRMYDWIARLIPSWGLAYPFVELALGLAYAADWNPTLTHSLTLVIMLIGAGGVIQSRLQKKSIQCACLGSVFNLPMSTVTVVEDLSMAAMAGWMLLS